jgi:hypothetical protein
MRPRLYDSITRIRVEPDRPDAVTGPRPGGTRRRGSRRPHADATVAAVRRLVEGSVMTYAEIAAKTGVACASICRWTRDGDWQRPLFAPRATDTVPTERASANLRRRTLAARLTAQAERAIRELEESPSVDLDHLADALELLKLVKLAARPRRRGESQKAIEAMARTHSAPPREVMRGLREGGVDTMRAPEEALEDFVASRAPPPKRGRSPRPRRSTRRDYHAWLLQRDGE